MKTCTRCNIEKPLDDFAKSKKGAMGRRSQCKTCGQEYHKSRKEKHSYLMARWRETKKDFASQISKNWYEANKEKVAAKRRQQRETGEPAKYAAEYRERNKAKLLEQEKTYREARYEDPVFKFSMGVRALIGGAFRRRGWKKNTKTQQIVGCSFDQLYVHLVQTALANYGYYVEGQEMHIDHVTPMITAKTLDDVVRLNHYTNLQWLTPEDNLKKGSKVDA